MSGYTPNPKTALEHAGNCQFQLDNVMGWLGCKPAAVNAALIKAECVVAAAQALVAVLEAECRKPVASPMGRVVWDGALQREVVEVGA